jgi:hypothetical protein
MARRELDVSDLVSEALCAASSGEKTAGGAPELLDLFENLDACGAGALAEAAGPAKSILRGATDVLWPATLSESFGDGRLAESSTFAGGWVYNSAMLNRTLIAKPTPNEHFAIACYYRMACSRII